MGNDGPEPMTGAAAVGPMSGPRDVAGAAPVQPDCNPTATQRAGMQPDGTSPEPVDDAGDERRGVRVHPRRNVHVQVLGDPRRGVTEALRDDLRRHPRPETGSERLSNVVECL